MKGVKEEALSVRVGEVVDFISIIDLFNQLIRL